MALGTNLFYYQEGTLAALQALEPFTDPLTWGHFVRDTTNDDDYWIEPGTGNLQPRGSSSGTSYTGFNFVGSQATVGPNVESGDTVFWQASNSIETLLSIVNGDTVLTSSLLNISSANVGDIVSVGASDSVAYISPSTLGGWRMTDDGSDIRQLDADALVTFLGRDGVFTEHLGTGSNSNRILRIGLDGLDAATAGQVLTVNSGTDGLTYVNPITIAAGSTAYLSIDGNNELSVSNLNITKPYSTAETSLADFIANDAQYSELEEGDTVITSGGGTFIHNGGSAGTTADFFEISVPGAGMTSFTITGTSGTPIVVTDGFNLTPTGQNGIVTSTSGNSLLIGLNTELATIDGNSPGVDGSTYFLTYNDGVFDYEDVLNYSDTSLSEANQVFTAERTVQFNTGSLTFISQLGGSHTMKLEDETVTVDDLEFIFNNNARGLQLTAPNGNKWRVQVNNIGALTSTLVV